MLITNRISNYKSKKTCNLDQFRYQPPGHLNKKWISKDGKIHLIRQMETMHLWHTFNMLMRIIDMGEWYEMASGPDQDTMAFDLFCREQNQMMEAADVARTSIQYIGHELFKREMSVKQLPDKTFKKKINRYNNLHEGFADSEDNHLKYVDKDANL